MQFGTIIGSRRSNLHGDFQCSGWWTDVVSCNCSGFALTLQTWQYQESSACPLCELPEENRDHLLQCPDPRAKEQFRKYIAPIPELLAKLETSPPLTDAIMGILRRFRSKQTINYRSFSMADGFRDSIKTQANISCFNFVLGRWTHKWKIVQQAHTTNKLEARKPPGDGLPQFSTNYPWFAGICGFFATTYYMYQLGLY